MSNPPGSFNEIVKTALDSGPMKFGSIAVHPKGTQDEDWLSAAKEIDEEMGSDNGLALSFNQRVVR